MVKNLMRAIITLPAFVLFLLSNVAAMAQSTATSSGKSDESERRDTGHPHPTTDKQMKNKLTNPSGAQPPPSPSGEKSDSTYSADRKKGFDDKKGGSTGY